jgi:hypothetical protein
MSGYKKRAVAPLAPRDALTASLVARTPAAAAVLSRARAVLAALRSNAATSPHARWTQARATGTKALQTLCNAWIEHCRSATTAQPRSLQHRLQTKQRGIRGDAMATHCLCGLCLCAARPLPLILACCARSSLRRSAPPPRMQTAVRWCAPCRRTRRKQRSQRPRSNCVCFDRHWPRWFVDHALGVTLPSSTCI